MKAFERMSDKSGRWTILAAGLLFSTLACAGGSGDVDALRTTIGNVRDVGVALLAWHGDQTAGSTTPSELAEGAVVDAAGYTKISADQVAELLVPDYLEDLPREDGWGHPLEYRLNRRNAAESAAAPGIFIRSPGSDGVFEGDSYTVEGFAMGDFSRDVVWADGTFVRYPQAASPPPT